MTADLADLPGLVVEGARRVRRRPVRTPDGQRSAIDVLVRVRRLVNAVRDPR